MPWLIGLLAVFLLFQDPTDPANDYERFVGECMMCHDPEKWGTGGDEGYYGMREYLRTNWYEGHGRMIQPVGENGERYPDSTQMGKNQFFKYKGCNYTPYKMELAYHTDGGADWECAFWGFVEESNWHSAQPGLTMGRHDLANIEAVTAFRRPDVGGPSGSERRLRMGEWFIKLAHDNQDLIVIYTTDDVYYNIDIRGLTRGEWILVPDGREPKYVSYCKCDPNQMHGADWPNRIGEQ